MREVSFSSVPESSFGGGVVVTAAAPPPDLVGEVQFFCLHRQIRRLAGSVRGGRGSGDHFLIITTAASDISLAEACLTARIRAGADTQLMVIPRIAYGAASTNKPGPIISDAIAGATLAIASRDSSTRYARSE